MDVAQGKEVDIAAAVARELSLPVAGVRAVLGLLDESNTVPFIARYRKERTGGLDEVQIRDVDREAQARRTLEERRQAILRSIEEQGGLTAELRLAIEGAEALSRLEDLYAPYRPKRSTRGQRAREAGLEPVAEALRADHDDVEALAAQHTGEGFETVEAVLAGARDVIAEDLGDNARARDFVRRQIEEHGSMVSKRRRGAEEDRTFEIYFEFSAPLHRLKPHQVLAIRRGEKEKILSAGLSVDDDRVLTVIRTKLNPARTPFCRRQIDEALEDGYRRLLFPAVERDVRSRLEEEADAHAIGVFALNLQNLLMQPPMPGRVVLGLDPGLRTGCKLAVVDGTGKLLATDTVYIHDRRREAAAGEIARLIQAHGVRLVAIGNGTGGRETEEVVAEALRDRGGGQEGGVQYAMIDEAGASVYSASDTAREEFPELDVSLRGAVSIARRLQDPLAELVKIDPKSIGVGMYQHDVHQGRLMEKLDAVVEDVVNAVGVDINSASQPLLARVAGIGPALAKRIVARRDEAGRFASRRSVLEVKGLGPRTFEQCAGFLRIRDGAEPLDATGIHPERYDFAREVLGEAGAAPGAPQVERHLQALERRGDLARLARDHEVGPLTLRDVLDALARPGRDPREELDAPVLRSDVLSIEDLREGMRLVGTVRNVIDFGAFVDIGVKQDGLVHISQLADGFVRDPHQVVAVGDRVDVRVLGDRSAAGPYWAVDEGAVVLADGRLLGGLLLGLVLDLEPAFGVDGAHAAGAGGRDGLAVDVVLNVAHGKHAGHVGVGAAGLGEDVPQLVEIQDPLEDLGIGEMADAQKEAVAGQLVLLVLDHVVDPQRLDAVLHVAQDVGHDAVPEKLDLGVLGGAIGHDLGGPQLTAPVDHRNLAGEARQEDRLFHGRIAATYHGHVLVLEKGAVAGGAAGDAAAP